VRRRLASLLLSLAVATGATAQGVPPGQKALLLLRVLAYDRNLRARAGPEVRIAVVYKPGHRASERERDALLFALEEVTGRAVVAGLPVRAVALPYQDAAGFRALLAGSGASTMYLCSGLEEAGRDLARAARERSVLSVCGSREQAMAGCAVALVDRGERAALVVNPRAAVGQGGDLDSALLSVAERVESPD
jgi:hypothetical protein